MTDHLLSVWRLVKTFDGVHVLNSVFLNFAPGRVKALIGPNGAGKTTLFNVISGLEKADAGKVLFKGTDITGMNPERIARMGISRTFQTTQVFDRLSVVENILVGRSIRTKVSFLEAGLWLPAAYREEHANLSEAFKILEFLGLYGKARRGIRQVTTLDRKLIELGRALALEPELLLLDEPFGGLTREESRIVSHKILQLREQGLAVGIIDHHFGAVSAISDDVAVLHQGRVIVSGAPEEVRKNRAVVAAYFIHESS